MDEILDKVEEKLYYTTKAGGYLWQVGFQKQFVGTNVMH